jgi:S1-C subfamily serine protease
MPTAAAEGASPAATTAAASASDPDAPTVELVALQRPVVQALAADDAAFAARYIPFVAEGVADGVRVYGIRPGSGLASLGLMNGDQIRSVGGQPVLDLVALRALPSRLLVEADLEVHVVRRGAALALRYRVTD